MHTFIIYAGFLEVLECKAQGHPFENVPSLLPINPWLAPYPPPGEFPYCILKALEYGNMSFYINIDRLNYYKT